MKCGKLIAVTVAGIVTLAPRPMGVEPSLPHPDRGVSDELRRMIGSASVEGLRWPDISDLQASLAALYEPRGYVPPWVESDRLSNRARQVIEQLGRSDDEGLNSEDYDVSHLSAWEAQLQRLGEGSDAAAARLDLAVSVALMRYAQALHQGRIDPQTAHFAIRRKDALDPSAFVNSLLRSGTDIRSQFAAIEPPFRGYRATRAALSAWLRLAAQETREAHDCHKVALRPGQASPDFAWLSSRLSFLGDLQSPRKNVPNNVYRGPVVDAVKSFQNRHGLAPNGILDAATCRALQTPLARRVEQLQLTLERWRWLPSSVLPAIVINIPEFELRAFDRNGSLALRMHVIVGKAYRHRTPVFEDTLQSVVVLPYWKVPLSIQRAEIVPALRADPEYLRNHEFETVEEGNRPITAPPQAELLQMLSEGRLRVRQLPGPANSLGLLKFNFPNTYDVYLHGTPAQHLFARSRRDFSHGCIRVEHPVALAEWVLRGQPGWTREKIKAASMGNQTLEIPVRTPVAVLVLYGTAVVEEDGATHFYEDVYGYDAELSAALAHGYPYPQ